MLSMNRPELLAPAGDAERLVAAVEYGADAVYLGSDRFGMRTAAASFGGDELRNACDYTHSKGVKVYLTCNTVPRNNELAELPSFIEYAAESGVDAFIITDIGVLKLAKNTPPMWISISPHRRVSQITPPRMHSMSSAQTALSRRESFHSPR